MKKIITLFLLITFFSGCKKAIENKQQDLVIQAMTNGQWQITSFTLNSSNITSDFAGYKFQYYSNKTVDAIKNGTVVKTGTWDGNATTMTTSADFPAAVNPLLYINGSWNILNSSWTYVVASQTVGATVKNMRLDKL
jgi:PBP1b-binding outer membrane lipoprotein LpoB